MTHVRVWQFEPAPGREQEFAAAYASDGPWARLFGRADGFIATALLAPAEPGGRWMTLDRWQSLGAFERFLAEFGEPYRSLDQALADFTAAETFIGAFDEQ